MIKLRFKLKEIELHYQCVCFSFRYTPVALGAVSFFFFFFFFFVATFIKVGNKYFLTLMRKIRNGEGRE